VSRLDYAPKLKEIEVTDIQKGLGVFTPRRVPVEALLIPVFADVVAPLRLTGGLVNCVEVAGTRTDEK
jgi:hypothetical protein